MPNFQSREEKQRLWAKMFFVKTVLSLFPKHYQHLSVKELAGLVRQVGLDTTNVVIRDGYWVTKAGIASELPEFTRVMREEGLKVEFASAGFYPEELRADPSLLETMAACGIKEFRLGWFRVRDDDVRGSLDYARAELESVVPLLERYGVRGVYQLHHFTLIPSPSAAWLIIKGLPHEQIGVELDPGNQSNEGFEIWSRSVPLLGEYIKAVGVKDSILVRDMQRANDWDKGWRRVSAPIYEGTVNWYDLVQQLAKIGFSGTFVLMPFYDQDNPAAMTEKLKLEVEYLRGILSEALES